MLWISANSRLVSWACTQGIGTAREIAGICAILSWEWLILVPWRAFCRRTFSAWFLGNIKLQIFTFFFFFFFLSQNACFLLSRILQFLEEIQGLNSIYLKLSCESPVSATCMAKSVILLMELLCWRDFSQAGGAPEKQQSWAQVIKQERCSQQTGRRLRKLIHYLISSANRL